MKPAPNKTLTHGELISLTYFIHYPLILSPHNPLHLMPELKLTSYFKQVIVCYYDLQY